MLEVIGGKAGDLLEGAKELLGNVDMSGIAEKIGEVAGGVVEKLQDVDMPDVDMPDIDI